MFIVITLRVVPDDHPTFDDVKFNSILYIVLLIMAVNGLRSWHQSATQAVFLKQLMPTGKMN